jgi:hypothetical protein
MKVVIKPRRWWDECIAEVRKEADMYKAYIPANENIYWALSFIAALSSEIKREVGSLELY